MVVDIYRNNTDFLWFHKDNSGTGWWLVVELDHSETLPHSPKEITYDLILKSQSHPLLSKGNYSASGAWQTAWAKIAYWKLWCSRVMLNYQKVSLQGPPIILWVDPLGCGSSNVRRRAAGSIDPPAVVTLVLSFWNESAPTPLPIKDRCAQIKLYLYSYMHI